MFADFNNSTIGAGISGLCAGSYLQMNAYDTEILELHNVPGGLCAAWKRKAYTFDFCIHWLVGSSPADSYYVLWSGLIDMAKLGFVDHEYSFKSRMRKAMHCGYLRM